MYRVPNRVYVRGEKKMCTNTRGCNLVPTESTGRNYSMTRRLFLKSSAGVLAGLAALPISCAPDRPSARRRTARFGMVTDCHYADVDAAGARYYRESLDKLRECVALMNAQKVDFLIELGDLKDQDRPPVERTTLSYLRAVENVLHDFHGPAYHVLGNHDMDSISKKQFLANTENTNIDCSRTHYSFESNGLHYVVLDANYKADGHDYERGNFDWTDANIPPEELAWLERDLAGAPGPVIVFTHQLLDGTGSVYVKNAAEVRHILEASGKVLAVFQGHHHAGSYSCIAGIHYYTLKALVEGSGPDNNSYAIVEIQPNDDIVVTGYRRAQSIQIAPNAAGPGTPLVVGKRH
jgi:predicted phosphodiesterase